MEKEKEFLHHQLKQKETELTNLKWIMWSSIIVITSVMIQTVSNIFSPSLVWISFIIGLAVYFYISFTIGQHSKWSEEVIIELFFYSFLVFIFSWQFIQNKYPYIAIFVVLTAGYFLGKFYMKTVDDSEEE
jgi:hypothetical protein